jgi:hypothetical protein
MKICRSRTQAARLHRGKQAHYAFGSTARYALIAMDDAG